MFKKMIITVLLVYQFQLVRAQDVYYGPKLGLNVTHLMLSGEASEGLKGNNGMKISSHFGGFAEIIFSDYFSLQPELLYTVKGSTFKKEVVDEYKSAYVYKYISIPILVKYYVTKDISIEGGPQFSYLLSAKNVEVKGVFSTPIGAEAAAVELKKDMKPIDLGFALGGSYFTKSGIYLGIRYEFGILDVSKPLDESDLSIRNGAIMLTTGLSMKY